MVPSDIENSAKPKLTVLQVLPALKVGGVERGVVEFAIYLKKRGYRSMVMSAGGPMTDILRQHGIEHLKLAVGKKSLNTLLLVKKLKKIIVELGVDILHARSRLPAWLCYWSIKKLSTQQRPVFVTTLHGLHSVNKYSAIMAKGDAVIAVSKTASAYLKDNYSQVLKNEPSLIYRGVDDIFQSSNAVDPEWLSEFVAKITSGSKVLDHNLKTVLLAGRLSAVKGVEHLIYWLINTQHNSKLLLTADASESNYSQKVYHLFEQHKVSHRVVWLGHEKAMNKLYAQVNLVVSTNKKPESFGRTVLEALTVGTPVVAFAHGGVAEVMSELYPPGLVTPYNLKELAKRIDQFLDAAPSVTKHKKFSNQRMFRQTLHVYHQLIQGKHE